MSLTPGQRRAVNVMAYILVGFAIALAALYANTYLGAPAGDRHAPPKPAASEDRR